jgi:hypothetical protein
MTRAELGIYVVEKRADAPEKRIDTPKKWIAALEKPSVALEQTIRPQISQTGADF